MVPEEASTGAKTQGHGGYSEGKLLSIEEEYTVVPVNIKFEPTTEVELAQDVSKEAVERIKASEETDETAPPASNDQPSWHLRSGSQGQARPQPGQSQAAEAADSPLSQPLSRGAETKAPPHMVTEGSTELEIETKTAPEAETVTKSIIDHEVLPRETQSIQTHTFPHFPCPEPVRHTAAAQAGPATGHPGAMRPMRAPLPTGLMPTSLPIPQGYEAATVQAPVDEGLEEDFKIDIKAEHKTTVMQAEEK